LLNHSRDSFFDYLEEHKIDWLADRHDPPEWYQDEGSSAKRQPQ
jgi:hypothetical protein